MLETMPQITCGPVSITAVLQSFGKYETPLNYYFYPKYLQRMQSKIVLMQNPKTTRNMQCRQDVNLTIILILQRVFVWLRCIGQLSKCLVQFKSTIVDGLKCIILATMKQSQASELFSQSYLAIVYQ